MTSISIRMSVVSLLEDLFFEHQNFDRTKLQIVLQQFYDDTIPIEFYSEERLTFITNVQDVSAIPIKFVCLPQGKKSQKVECAMYLMGQLRESLEIPTETVKTILKNCLTTNQPTLIKLRSLWLVERAAANYNADKNYLVEEIFNPIVKYFC